MESKIKLPASKKSADIPELTFHKKTTSKRSQTAQPMYNKREVHYFKQSTIKRKQYKPKYSRKEDFQQEEYSLQDYQKNEDFNFQEDRVLQTSTPINEQLDIDVTGKNASQNLNSSRDNYYNAGPVQELEDFTMNYKVPFVVQMNLKELIKAYPNGISCLKILPLYKKKFNNDLKYTEYGYKSLIQMISSLKYFFHYKKINPSDYMIYDVDVFMEEPAKIEETSYIDKELCLPNVVDITVLRSFPLHTVTLEDKIPVKKIKNIYDFIDIRVTDIHDPSKFWFSIIDKNENINELTDKLQQFYNENRQKYLIPKHMIMKGIYCATVFENEFHRAIIIGTLPQFPMSTKVFFIDYGTVSWVDIENTCFLHRDFMHLPAQAIRGRLAGIIPEYKNTQWSINASNNFLDACENKELVAYVCSVDKENKCFELLIDDTSTNEDIYINDKLVKDGHAIFLYQEQKENPNVNDPKPIVENTHLYPTFEELVSLSVPPSFEMLPITQSNTMHELYSHYFTPTKSDRKSISADEEQTTQNFKILNNHLENKFDMTTSSDYDSHIKANVSKKEVMKNAAFKPLCQLSKFKNVQNASSSKDVVTSNSSCGTSKKMVHQENRLIRYDNIVRIDPFNLNCILYKNEPYVILKDIQRKFLYDASVVYIKRILVKHFIEVENINLKNHKDLADKLKRYKLIIDDEIKVLQVLALKWLPRVIKLVTNKPWHLRNFNSLLENLKAGSHNWICQY